MSELFYQVGGSLSFNHPSYIERKADQELLNLLKHKQFCYVFNSRQMGKSSLRVRTIYQLQQEKKICLSVDITSLGSDVTQEQWYAGLINQLFSKLNLSGQINLKSWLNERKELAPIQKLAQFVENILLKYNDNIDYFIFIDEIDKVLTLNFSLDDFFSWIRYCYNQRAEYPQYQRITFILFGVATPADLIQSKVETPFNIGNAIELTGFSQQEVTPLLYGLKNKSTEPEIVLKEILNWTSGQPFLTQKICYLISQTPEIIIQGKEKEYIENLIENKIIKNWEGQDEPVHLRTIRDRILFYKDKSSSLLGLYQNILIKGSILAQNTQQESQLRLSGLIVKQENQLKIYNRIYQAVFNIKWLEQEFEKLRPYSESIIAWQAANFQDTSRLLRGKALEDAEIWAKGKNLSNLDYQFLADSRKVASQEIEETLKKSNNILQKANSRAKQILFASIGASILLLIISGFIYKNQQEAILANELNIEAQKASKEFSYDQMNSLRDAYANANKLYKIVQDGRSLQNYPAITPMLVLNNILTRLRELHKIQDYSDNVNSLAYSKDGNLITSASSDGTLKIINLKNKSIKTIVKENTKDPIYSVSINPQDNSIALADKNGVVKISSVDGKLIKIFKAHNAPINAISFNSTGKLFITASRDHSAKLWNREGKLINILNGHHKSVSSAVFAPNNQEIATVSGDGTLKRWNLSGQLKSSLSLNVPIYDISYSPDGNWLAVALKDGSYILLNLKNNQLIKKYRAHTNVINSIKYSPDGKFLVTASKDGTVKLWTNQGKLLENIKAHQESVNDARFSPDNRYLATASNDPGVKIWSLAQSTSLLSVDEIVSSSSYNPNKKLIAITTNLGAIYILNNHGKLLKKFPVDSSDWLYTVDWSNDGRYLFTGSSNGVFKLYLANGKLLKILNNFAQSIYAVKFSPNERFLAIGYQSKSQKTQVDIYDFNKANLKKIKTFIVDNDANPIYNLSFDVKSQQIALSSRDNSNQGLAWIWDIQRNSSYKIVTSKKLLYQTQFSPQDEDTFVTSSRDGQVKLWNNKGRDSVNLSKENDFLPVYKVAFSTDGQLIATGAEDGTIRLWRKDGNLVAEFADTQEPVYGLAFLNNNQDLLALTRNGTVKIWPIGNVQELKNLLEQAQKRLQDYPIKGRH